jgi:hypothetical protein
LKFKIHYNGDGHPKGVPIMVHCEGEVFMLSMLDIKTDCRFNSNLHASPKCWIECNGFLAMVGTIGCITKEKPKRNYRA